MLRAPKVIEAVACAEPAAASPRIPSTVKVGKERCQRSTGRKGGRLKGELVVKKEQGTSELAAALVTVASPQLFSVGEIGEKLGHTSQACGIEVVALRLRERLSARVRWYARARRSIASCLSLIAFVDSPSGASTGCG